MLSVPTAEADNPLNRYDAIDADMIERAPIVVAVIFCTTAVLEANGPFTASYLNDRDTVWEKLSAMFIYSTNWSY